MPNVSNNSDDPIQSLNFELPKLVVLQDLNEYSSIVQRPLFAQSRKATRPTQSSSQVATVNGLSHLILVGTARSTEVEIGIIADTKLKKIERLKVGEKYNEWDISNIEDDHIVFQNDELEYKLFTTPIENKKLSNQKYQKSKIERAKSEIISAYKDWERSAKPVTNTKKKTKLTGNTNYRNYKSKNDTTKNEDNSSIEKPIRKSPIKIPVEEEEKDLDYYEAFDEEDESSSAASNDSKRSIRDITADDFYDDEEITEEELKALEELGAEIFLD